MNDNEIQQAKSELKGLQDKIIAQKRILSKLNTDKEKWFSKRAEIGSQIANEIRLVKDKRAKRDELTQSVQAEKKERRNYSQEIRDLIAEVKKLREERKKRFDAAGVKGNPRNMKRDIERIEFTLQTEPMPYKEEKAKTKQLKELKAQYAGIKQLDTLSKQIKDLSRKIDELKKESDEVHENLQEKAEESQEFHEEVVERSKSIDELKAEEEAAYKQFSDLKEEYNGEKDKLQELVDTADALREKLGEHADDIARIEKKKNKEILKQKSEEVEEKVKKGKKLTTEDLLAFQAGGNQ